MDSYPKLGSFSEESMAGALRFEETVVDGLEELGTGRFDTIGEFPSRQLQPLLEI